MLNAIVNGANPTGPLSGPMNRSEFGNELGDHARQPANGGQSPNRCLYIGNLPEDATTSDICDAIRGGLLLSVKYTPEKHYAVSPFPLLVITEIEPSPQFVTFADPMQATHFYHQATSYGLMVRNKKVKVSWGRGNNFVHPSVLNAVVGSGATRIVYIGGIDDFDTYNEDRLRDDFGTFGGRECELFVSVSATDLALPPSRNRTSELSQGEKGGIRQLVRDPSNSLTDVRFAHSCSAHIPSYSCDVRHASKALEGMKSKPEYADMRLAYGKDRCANHPRPG